MVNRVYPRDQLAERGDDDGPQDRRQALLRTEDDEGGGQPAPSTSWAEPEAMESVFGLHHLCHAHNMLKFGLVIDPAGVPGAVAGKEQEVIRGVF
jgi:hypothetical protein